MIKLSIVIVNYNVEHFLEHCLLSVRQAVKNIETEIFVVDNNSVDNSVPMLKEKFPEVKLIENKENVGFAKANNQAIRISQGEYVLLLNPDTVVEEDTFTKCIDFMDKTPDAGALGVKMIDGQGKILKESKRGFPTPWVCFCKMTGLTSLFPNSKKYCGYYMGHLSYDETNQVDILAGAYMLMRKKALDKSGLLDETFFMYGEDIDLSYRITLAGYKNYYFADTNIIHYKGESTKKGSLNYVYTFYNAMDIFAKKHLSSSQTKIFSLIIKLAIWFRASLAFFKRIFKNLLLPLIDFVLLYLGFFFLEKFWAVTYWHNAEYYPLHYLIVAVPLYIIILLFGVYVFGGYEKKFKPYKLMYGVGMGMISLLVVYSLMPASMRYSRAMVLMGSILSFFILFAIRYLRHFIQERTWTLSKEHINSFAIVGDKAETQRVTRLLKDTNLKPEFIGMVSDKEDEDKNYFLGNINQLEDIIRIYKVGEVIFCSKTLSQSTIISTMTNLSKENVRFTIAPDSDFIIGSNTINTPTDIYVMSVSSISSETNRRKKRLLDFSLSFVFLLLTVVLLFVTKKPFRAIKNNFLVLISKKTFVGYDLKDTNVNDLPKLKPSIFSVSDNMNSDKLDEQTLHRLNLLYARNYNVKNDLDTVLKNFRRM
ncbi:MAG: glycosyltransferase [Bacteroidales bacterium]|nr:glycosyltransferase [Bacteroidales bacterium]